MKKEINGVELDIAPFADLWGANLQDALLQDAHLPTTSHDAIAELLRQAAGGDVHKRMIAGLVLVSRSWCWDDFSSRMEKEEFLWALEVLLDWKCFAEKIVEYREGLEAKHDVS